MTTALSAGEQAERAQPWLCSLAHSDIGHTRESLSHKPYLMNTITSDTAQASFGPTPPHAAAHVLTPRMLRC